MFPLARLPLAERYAELLATEGVLRGLIGPREAPRLWDRHLLNSAALAQAIPESTTVCDIGSGAGLPGIVLAIAREDLTVTLVEPLLRRTAFLEEVVADLGLANVEVIRGRAEALHGSRRFDVVTSRAVAPMGRLLEWSMPLVARDGALVAMKGSSVADELAEATATLGRLGCAQPEVIELGSDVLAVPTFAVRVAWSPSAKVSWRGAPATPRRRPGRTNNQKPRRPRG